MLGKLKEKAETKHSELLKTLNMAVVSLFWEIGVSISERLKQDRTADEESTLKEISNNLVPLFGSYLNLENLLLMKIFAKACPFKTMQSLAPFINWEYISVVLNLKSESELIFYTELIHAECLTPRQLKKKVLSGKVNNERIRIVGTNNAFRKSNTKPFYRNTLNLYFGKKNGSIFRKLFEPKDEDHNLNFETIRKNTTNHETIIDIYYKILSLQSSFNYILSLYYNNLFWEMGNELIRSSSNLNMPISDTFIEECIRELNKSFPLFFNKAELSACIKFADQYRKPGEYIKLTREVPWTYIKILLEVEDKKEQIFIAEQISKFGITLPRLKKMLSNGYVGSNNIVELLSKRKLVYKPAIIGLTKDKNNNFIAVTRIVSPNIKYDLHNNIYKNQKLLTFLKKNTYLD